MSLISLKLTICLKISLETEKEQFSIDFTIFVKSRILMSSQTLSCSIQQSTEKVKTYNATNLLPSISTTMLREDKKNKNKR